MKLIITFIIEWLNHYEIGGFHRLLKVHLSYKEDIQLIRGIVTVRGDLYYR
ncbi:MAG: hypothetical protein E6X51_16390 [Terrisporobacter othiniensis]|nr:hypothetical protein [Terrisporobacter othiniensis]